MIALVGFIFFLIGAVKLSDWDSPLMWALCGLAALALAMAWGDPWIRSKRG